MAKMKTYNIRLFLLFALIIIDSAVTLGQTNTVGLLFNDSTNSFKGYTLFSPLKSKNTYLINMDGMLVRSWTSDYTPGQSVMLLHDGSILRPATVTAGNPFVQGGVAGRVEKYDWSGNLTWSFNHYGATYTTHHDIEYMPNGNILCIAFEKKTLSEAAAAGRNITGANYTEVWSEKIIEVHPEGSSGGTIVWEWHIWDHLVQDYDPTKANYGNVALNPGLFDINFGDKKADWLHMNAIRYNPLRDEIMVSVHATHEILIIDHSTTTQQAAGHTGGNRGKGGDILYRWGNPVAYKSGTAADQKLFSQHDARWIESGYPGAGNILIFNNGTNRPGGAYSSIEEIVPPIGPDSLYIKTSGSAYGPTAPVWSYAAQPSSSFYSVNISGATRMLNGNTLICEGTSGRFFEVAPAGQTVWTYINPVGPSGPVTQGQTPVENIVFKIYRYAPDYSGLAGRDLTPLGPIELYPSGIQVDESSSDGFEHFQNYPNPFSRFTKISFLLRREEKVTLKVYNTLGQECITLYSGILGSGTHSFDWDAGQFNSGIFFCSLQRGDKMSIMKLICIK